MALPVAAHEMGLLFWFVLGGMCLAFSVIIYLTLDDWLGASLAFPAMLAGAVIANYFLLELLDTSLVEGPIDGVVGATLVGALAAALLVILLLRMIAKR